MTYHLENQKLFDLQTACDIRERLRNSGKRVVLTNGCFDLLHAGHIFSITQAADYGDSLWIALNSDLSVKKIKRDKRPIFNEQVRAYMLSALEKVQGIFIFDGPNLANEILRFQPDVYVKSGDYSLSKLNQDELSSLQEVHADIRFVPFLEGFSTTNILQEIVKKISED